MTTLGLIKTGQGIECPVLPVPQIHVGWLVCVVINAGRGSGFNAGHVKPCIVSCFRSMSKKVLNDECARVFVRVGIRGQRLFWSRRSWPQCTLFSLHVATWWCKSPLQTLSCLTAPPPCEVMSPVFLRPGNKSIMQIIPQFHPSLLQLPLSSFVCDPPPPPPPSCQKTIIFMMCRWVFPSSRSQLASKKGLRVNLELRLLLYLPPFYPSEALKFSHLYPHHIQWNMSALCVPAEAPTSMCFRLHACWSRYRCYALLPVANAVKVLTWWNVMAGHWGLEWRFYRFHNQVGVGGLFEFSLPRIMNVCWNY